jgi:hypothetical protein
VSPGLVVGALLVLIGAQLAAVVQPRRHYVAALLLAAVGFVAGELFAIPTHLGGPLLAGLHPLADAVGIAIAEAVGLLLAPVRRAP